MVKVVNGLSNDSVQMIEIHLEQMEILFGAVLGEIENSHDKFSEGEFRKFEKMFQEFQKQKVLVENMLITEPEKYDF